MSKKHKAPKKSLADPSRLPSLDEKDRDENDQLLVQVVIETPKGSRNKYDLDAKEKVFRLKKVLPAGMTFPYDFGFVPRTLAEDGDPVDVLVLMDEPAFPGCVLKCRLIGIIEGVQGDSKKKVRNDRLIAIEKNNHSFAAVQHINDLGQEFIQELEDFFINYHELSGQQFKVIAVKGPKQAQRRIGIGMRTAKG